MKWPFRSIPQSLCSITPRGLIAFYGAAKGLTSYQAASEYQLLKLFAYTQQLLPEYHLEFYKSVVLVDGDLKHCCKTLSPLPEGIIQPFSSCIFT